MKSMEVCNGSVCELGEGIFGILSVVAFAGSVSGAFGAGLGFLVGISFLR